jgi:hypothetical protein
MRGVLRFHTPHAEVIRSCRPLAAFAKARVRDQNPESSAPEEVLFGRLGARKARHLCVGKVSIFGIISRPSLDVLALIGPSPPVRITEQSTGARRFWSLPSPSGWHTLAEG